MTEWLMILSMGMGGVLYAAGGTAIPRIGGQKWLRREAVPILWAVIAFLSGFIWWKCLVFAIAQDITFRLPYGDRTPYWMKAVVFSAFAVPSMIFGFTIWQPIAAAIIFLMFILSNWPPTARSFPWKVCEQCVGLLIGVIIAVLISSPHPRLG